MPSSRRSTTAVGVDGDSGTAGEVSEISQIFFCSTIMMGKKYGGCPSFGLVWFGRDSSCTGVLDSHSYSSHVSNFPITLSPVS